MRNKGEGSVYKRKQDGMWCAALELPPLNGKRRKKVLVAKTKAEVLRKFSAAKAELERSGDIPTASQTLETWLTYWLDKVAAKRVRPSTLYTYRRQLEKQVIPVLGKVRLDKLTSAHIRRLHDHMNDAGLSSTYALTTHRLLSKALTDAVREGRVGRNVATLVDAPKLGRSDGEALTVDEAITVLDYARASLESDLYDPAPVLWATYLLTGIRRSELLALEWDRVTDVIDLSWQLQRIKEMNSTLEARHLTGKLYLTRPKSRSGWRIIPLVEPLKTMLEEHRRRSPSNRYGLVFARADGQPIEPSRASAAWKSWYADVGLTDKHVPLHFLRHTAVDLLYAAGVDDDVKIEIVGHSNRSMTQAYKTKGNRPRLTDAMERFSALLAREPE
jgi:integrase